jgi:Protein of unknown function (DUF2442)
MQSKPSTPQDRSIGLNLTSIAGIFPAIEPRTPWRVVEVKTAENFQIQVRFIDGTQGKVDMSQLVHSPNAGVFAQLSNADVFNQVSLCYGTVTWPGDIDLAPDAMYQAIKNDGYWVLR